MRYRPFTNTGLSSSALTLSLTPGAACDAHKLVCTALEGGVNSFCFAAGDEEAAEALRRAVATTGRGVLILMLRLDLDGPGFERQVRSSLAISGASFMDAVVVAPAGPGALSKTAMADLEALRGSRLTRQLALAADGATAEARLADMEFDILATRYGVASGSAERRLLKVAASRGLTVVARDYHVDPSPSHLPNPGNRLGRLFRAPRAVAPRAYGFLEQTHGWEPRQITLGYALTEPCLASVMVEAADPSALERLIESVERELPAGVAAQIEIARFSGIGDLSAA